MRTHQQDLARQIKALKRVGRAVIYADTASGKSMAERPELGRALDDLDSGDELVIAEWDRATRSMWDGLQIIKPAIDAGATLEVLDRGSIDLSTRSLENIDSDQVPLDATPETVRPPPLAPPHKGEGNALRP